MEFVGNSQRFLEAIEQKVNELDHQLQVLMPVVIEDGYSRKHTLLSWQTQGKAKVVTGESSHWSRLSFLKREKEMATSTHGVSVNIPYNQHEWESLQDVTHFEQIISASLQETLSQKLIDLCLYGEDKGRQREGLLNLKSAQKLEVKPSSASSSIGVKELVEAVLKAKELSIQAGSQNSNGFRVLLPLSLERTINDFYNTAGTLTGREYLEDKYGFSLAISERITHPVILSAQASEGYFHRFNQIKVSLKAIDPHSGSLTYFGSIAGAWLVMAYPERVVYLTLN